MPDVAVGVAARVGTDGVSDFIPHATPYSAADTSAPASLDTSDTTLLPVRTRARIAIYDDLLSAPRIVDIGPAPLVDFIENIASSTYDHAHNLGGSLPYSVIREIAENFIHAHFKECTVSILDRGNTIRFSDQGPGIEKKRLVQQPGITSATAEMKRFIRGVGSGFPLVREYLEFRNGVLSIDDNALQGAVITLSLQAEATAAYTPLTTAHLPHPQSVYPATTGATALRTADGGRAATGQQGQQGSIKLGKRDIQVLKLMYEQGTVGPNDLMEPLEVSAPTAHRILVGLEQKGLIESTPGRKRILTSAGLSYLEIDTGGSSGR
jgi:hypothetical protein